MAHEISDTDNLFSVREMPWHGLGVVLDGYPTIAEAKAIAHPWEPIPEPVYRKKVEERPWGPPHIGYEEVKGWQLNARSDNDQVLGVVASSWSPVLNQEMYDIAEAIEGQDKGSVQLETGGSLKGGRKVWLALRFRDPIEIPGDPNGTTIPFYSIQNSHDGSGAFRGQATNVRVVCANTSLAADIDAKSRGTEFVFRHTSGVKQRIEEAREALRGWRSSVAAVREEYERLVDLRLTAEQVDDFIKVFIPMPVGEIVSQRVKANVEDGQAILRGILDGPTCEGINRTAYGLVAASVEYSQWYRRSTGPESRFKRAFLDTSKLTRDAMRIAVEVSR